MHCIQNKIKGFVSVNLKWAGFSCADYISASQSVYSENERDQNQAISYSVNKGDFDLREFEIARSEFLDKNQPYMIISNGDIRFSAQCIQQFGTNIYAEILLNPLERKIVIRPTVKENRNGVVISTKTNGKYYPKLILTKAFGNLIYELFGWNKNYKYNISGTLIQREKHFIYIFDITRTEIMVKDYLLNEKLRNDNSQLLMKSGKHFVAVPEKWIQSFGNSYYFQQHPIEEINKMTVEDLNLGAGGKEFYVGERIAVTNRREIEEYVASQLGDIYSQEDNNG